MNAMNRSPSSLRLSRERMVPGRWVWVLAVVAAAAAISLCAAQARAFCESCNATAVRDCVDRGLIVCEYDLPGRNLWRSQRALHLGVLHSAQG